MTKQKWLWTAVGVVVVVLVVWAVVAHDKSKKTVVSMTTSATTAAPAVTPAPTATVKSNNANYVADLAKYGLNRIQFDQACEATPFNVVYKNGTTIMLDNRASITHTIKIAGHTYSIGAYDFALVTLTGSPLPYTNLVDCDSQQNVATIKLE